MNSPHQYGNAVDLNVPGPAAGKSTAQLYCILETAALSVGVKAFAEDLTELRVCNLGSVNHVHVQK